jgi:hypothetical protein
MKTFKIYKPTASHANFLEIQHFGSGFINLIGRQVKYGREQGTGNREQEETDFNV